VFTNGWPSGLVVSTLSAEVPGSIPAPASLCGVLGKCLPLLLAGLALDVAGLTLLLVGVFADVRAADGQFYGDFFIFTGALVIFVSLAFWVMWYAGNVRVTPGDPRDARAEGLAARLVRKLSERLSRKMATATPRAAGDALSWKLRHVRISFSTSTGQEKKTGEEGSNEKMEKVPKLELEGTFLTDVPVDVDHT
uniref:Transmembrane protein 238 n=1 Tax=Hippocampus comes TaxID=109280 RepID=A0A3Q3DU70_HIPCM